MLEQILVDEQKIDKPGTGVKEDVHIRLLGNEITFCWPWRSQARQSSQVLWLEAPRLDSGRPRSIHGRFYGLCSTKRCGQGLCRGCRLWTTGLEAKAKTLGVVNMERTNVRNPDQ